MDNAARHSAGPRRGREPSALTRQRVTRRAASLGRDAILSRRLGLAALGVTALLLTGGVTISLAMDRVATERQVMREVGVLADNVAAQARALLGGLDQALLTLAQLEAAGLPRDVVAAALATQEGTLPNGIVLALLHADGLPDIATESGRRRLVGLEHGALARLAAALPAETQAGPPVLNGPVRSTFGDLLPMMRRLPDGRTALALLPLRLLKDLYAHLDLSPGGSMVLLDRQTRLLARMPVPPLEAIGLDILQAPRQAAREQPAQGWNGRVVSPIDQMNRFTAMRPVPDFGLSVAVGLSGGEALSQWAGRAWLGGGLTLLALAAAGIGLLLVGREARRRLRAQADATARLERLARGSAGIAAVSELPALLGHIGRLAREALSVPYACITLQDSERQDSAAAQRAISLAPEGGTPAPLPPEVTTALEAWATDRALAADALPRIWPAGDGLPARACIGLRDEQGRVLGALAVAGLPDGFLPDDEAMLAQLARLAEIAIRNRGLIAAAHRAAEEASTARERVERLLEAVSDGFVALDAGWCFTYANAAALRMMGHAREDVVGRSIWALFPELIGLEAFEHLQAVASRGQERDFEQYLEADQRWFEAHAFPAADGVAMFFRDVSEARRAQHQMQQGQRMEAVGRLTGSVAHDFNNLLAVITGNAEMLEEDLADDPAGRHSAWLIRDAAERGTVLVRHLLAFAGHQPRLKPEEVVPETLLDGMMPLLRRAVGQKVRLNLVLGSDLPRLQLMAGQAENAILNLAVNARDAMPDGGVLTLAAEAVTLEEEALEGFPEASPGRFLCLTVSDTGFGMAPDVLKRATEPFFSTKEKGQGAGLGLASVLSFARQNGGVLRLDSLPGQGTRVMLMLPESEAPAAAASAAFPPPRGDERVLLVEDEPALRHSTAAQLTRLGYQVTVAEGGPEALAMLDEGLCPDLLLSDVILPGGISGPRLAVMMRERLPELRVLLVSGYALPDAARDAGLEDVTLLPKPLDASSLALHLRRLLDAPAAPLRLQSVEFHARGLV
jgi:PAS domain S-box-containing protein